MQPQTLSAQDFQKTYGAIPSTAAASAVSTGTTGPTAPSSPTTLSADEFNQKYGTASSAAVPKNDPNKLAEFAKGIFSAPATLIARPIQAVAELAGASPDAVDKFSNKYSGGLVAPVPQNGADVKKDIGRAAETVALGTGAPIAGGALFGAGNSLEQGNDLFSTQTALDTALGAGSGKVLEWVGKPLLNGAGKVVGTITPKIIKDVVAGGADAITKFAATHDLPLGVSAVTKPLSEGIQKGTQAVDEALGTGLSRAGTAIKNTAAEQFPGLNPVEHYKAMNARDIAQPTTVNSPSYAKATAVFNDAKGRGINLDQVANDRGIIHDQIAEGGKYNTKDTAENLRDNNYKVSDTLARPAIKAADAGVENIPIEQVHGAMLKKIHDIPASSIDPEERAAMLKQINKRYGPGGVMDVSHPNGFSLEDIHDARISSAKNGGYRVGRSNSDTTIANRFRNEGQVFSTLFDRHMPAEAGLQPFRKELEKNFMLADYLDQLHGKSVPEGITKKSVKLFGRGIGGVIGSKVGGFPGFLAGSRFGDMLFGGFETLPNPIKTKVLQNIVHEDPATFQTLRKYISDQNLQTLLRKALPASGKSSYTEVAPKLFATPKGTITPNAQEALDANSVESGAAKSPKSGRSSAAQRKLIDMIQQNSEGPYTAPNDLPVIKAGRIPKKPKRLNDIL